jgi:hypothetical protein
MKLIYSLIGVACLAALPTLAQAETEYSVFRVCEDQHVLRTSDGAEAGRVEYIVVDPGGGRVVSSIVSGGVIGEKLVAVPFSSLRFGAQREVVLTEITRERLVSAPVIERNQINVSVRFQPTLVERSFTHFGIRRDSVSTTRTTETAREGNREAGQATREGARARGEAAREGERPKSETAREGERAKGEAARERESERAKAEGARDSERAKAEARTRGQAERERTTTEPPQGTAGKSRETSEGAVKGNTEAARSPAERASDSTKRDKEAAGKSAESAGKAAQKAGPGADRATEKATDAASDASAQGARAAGKAAEKATGSGDSTAPEKKPRTTEPEGEAKPKKERREQ